ncbi:helix-turn-helix domain-containing protein [Mangrovimonas cancribranchiae]|uniref:Helix-turn-helix domain-containing protein n=1 Tax=Mangrovimonas cancribranchiae TaxID=3080055 RepID=A0AAU6P0E8_9FLAO
MTPNNPHNSFLSEAKSLVLDQISNEQFGVSELAEAMHMSRSNLLRKIKKHTGLSASRFIREIRLQKAAELLLKTDMTASEVSFEVGFGNPSYFTKCYREYFGYPPGETKSRASDISDTTGNDNTDHTESKTRYKIYIAVAAVALIATLAFFRNELFSTSSAETLEKSVAFLPFKNLSEDPNNLYFINGIMEASLTNLQKIEDVRVISRTSTEKYRNQSATVTQIGEELKVSYLVEGSGQKIDNAVLLNIQLIDVANDKPIWSEQYQYELKDVFTLQNTVAKKIALAIEANITPDELKIINKKPTDNLLAYDYYLKGLEAQQKKTAESLLKAIDYFNQAIAEDQEYANAYAQIAISYFFLEMYKPEKEFLEQLNENADKALLYDSTSELSLIAKAVYYIGIREYRLAIPHLEKALDYNPNASIAVLILSDLYARAMPNTSKYLSYALKGMQLEVNANDSISQSYLYLHLSNALVQTGFAKEAVQYINRSLDFNPNNEHSPYLKRFIEYANDKNMEHLITRLEAEWKKDTSRVDITQELGKLYYFQENYEQAYFYYHRYKELQLDKVDLYPQENLKIGLVFKEMGYDKKASEYFEAYDAYCKADESIYQPASLAMQLIYQGNYDGAIAKLNEFSQESNFQYWMVLFLEKDPLLKRLKSHPEYDVTISKIKQQFWNQHHELRITLEKNNLI